MNIKSVTKKSLGDFIDENANDLEVLISEIMLLIGDRFRESKNKANSYMRAMEFHQIVCSLLANIMINLCLEGIDPDVPRAAKIAVMNELCYEMFRMVVEGWEAVLSKKSDPENH